MQKLKYKLLYYKRVIFLFFGFCPKCYTQVNYTMRGRPICPSCGR